MKMKNLIIFGSLILSTLSFARTLDDVLDGYHKIQTALAQDQFPKTQDLAAQEVSIAEEWLKGETENDPAFAFVSSIETYAKKLSGTSYLPESSKISEITQNAAMMATISHEKYNNGTLLDIAYSVPYYFKSPNITTPKNIF